MRSDSLDALVDIRINVNKWASIDLRSFSLLREVDLNGNPLRKINVMGLEAF
ncbi:hypothetical protein [Sphingobacterium sp. HMA12]|uniref:hypothetical protein n=1 Tax=Sphingobacterium sp. HMA12 TaxID=2050894 RepID=UPI001315A0E9|nr:hypothetical protein [Sphingobacterium sp. HMA12]